MRRIRGLLIGYLVIAVLTGWPVALTAAAGIIASWHGCTLNEANPHPCVVGGEDIGATLYGMAMTMWLMIAFIPIAAIAAAVWTIAWLLWTVWRQRQARAERPI